MRKLFFGAVLLVLATACHSPVKEYNLQKGTLYTIADSTNKTDNFYVYDKSNRFAWYPIFYLGETKSQYTLGCKAISARFWQKLDTTFITARRPEKLLNIFVDTTLDVAQKNVYQHPLINTGKVSKSSEEEYIIDSVKYYKAYPVFITNKSDSTLHLGYFNYVNFMYREAKNERGEWVAIETIERTDGCATMARAILLPPGQSIVAKLMRYKGDFKTTCRLRFGMPDLALYSNTFIDHIDKRMLTDRFVKRR